MFSVSNKRHHATGEYSGYTGYDHSYNEDDGDYILIENVHASAAEVNAYESTFQRWNERDNFEDDEEEDFRIETNSID